MEDYNNIEQYNYFATNPLAFIETAFGLTAQKVKPEYQTLLNECRESGDYGRMKLAMFESFVKYKNLSWQQVEIILAVSRAVKGESSRKIAIRSGHGIGKSSVISIVMIWFLFCNYLSVIGCTAPTQTQMEDVLWKEIGLWINRLPESIKGLFEWSKSYVRVGATENDKLAWYARAKTSSKENSEALAGLHSDNVMIVADEASGVDEQIFITAMSARTNENSIFVMISNPTRLEGYFYKAFKNNTGLFQLLNFNSEESPLVDNAFVDEIIAEYGQESDEYRVRVKGEFPKEGGVDDKGRIPLFNPEEITFVDQGEFSYDTLGIDPSGSGRDISSFVARNNFYAEIVKRQQTSDEKDIARATVQVMALNRGIKEDRIYYDNFGVGANVGQELSKEGIFANGVNRGNKADNSLDFLNKRAECFWRLKQEIKNGLKLVGTAKDWQDLFMVKYKSASNGRQMKIMSKEEMRREYGKSPDDADALALTFRESTPSVVRRMEKKDKPKRQREIFNPYTGERVSNLSSNVMEW